MKMINIMDPETVRRGPQQVKAAICYIFDKGKALMIKRIKEPFTGCLVAPGGKFEAGETPVQCVKREIKEETGLDIKKTSLKIVTSELGPKNYNWLLYIFTCDDFEGDVRVSDEGELVWAQVDKLKYMNMCDIDKRLLSYVLDKGKYFMKLRYDDDKNCSIEDVQVLDCK